VSLYVELLCYFIASLGNCTQEKWNAAIKNGNPMLNVEITVAAVLLLRRVVYS